MPGRIFRGRDGFTWRANRSRRWCCACMVAPVVGSVRLGDPILKDGGIGVNKVFRESSTPPSSRKTDGPSPPSFPPNRSPLDEPERPFTDRVAGIPGGEATLHD